MIKIIERPDHKFVWKEYDEQGNSIAVGEVGYDTYRDCEDALAGETIAKDEPVVDPEPAPTVPVEMITPEMAEAGVTASTPFETREAMVAQFGEEEVARIEQEALPTQQSNPDTGVNGLN